MQPSTFSPQLDVATPERIAVSLPIAGLGHRTLAYLVDMGCFFLFWVVAYFALTLVMQDVVSRMLKLDSWLLTVAVLGVFAMQWVYWTFCELAFEGQTLGKRVVGIRVVRADGSPIGLFESAIRNLFRAVDFLPASYALGLCCMLLDRHQRRLGDFAAGTLLIRVEKVALEKYLEPSNAAQPVGASAGLSSAETELVLSFLQRASSLEPSARARVGEQLVRRLGAALPEAERPAPLQDAASIEAWLRERVRGSPGT